MSKKRELKQIVNNKGGISRKQAADADTEN